MSSNSQHLATSTNIPENTPANSQAFQRPYIGRYAPSPTGRLHLGNLRTALLAWLHARLHKGQFLLRMDDLDTPRVVPGSAEQIVQDLQWLGLDWDGEIEWQSQQQTRYQTTLTTLQQQGLVYPCFCSRKDIQQAASAPHGKTAVYPQTCRNLTAFAQAERAQQKQAALRLQVAGEIAFTDGIFGPQTEDMSADCGDFIVKRADGLFAYQLAVVLDDAAQGVTDVLRGADLLHVTGRQAWLHELLGFTVPQYWHVPLLLDKQGQRLSKRDGSESLAQWQAQGKTSEQVIACLVHSIGLFKSTPAMSANELLEALTLTQLLDHLRKLN